MSRQKPEENNIFGNRLKYLRRNLLDMTQKEFSKLVDIPQPNLSSYEIGRNKPTVDILITISEKCNVSIDWLCGKDSDRNSMYTLGDVASFLFDFYSIEQFDCGTASLNPDINNTNKAADQDVTLTFSPTAGESNPQLTYSSFICEILRSVFDLHTQLRNYDCSQDYYDAQKTILIEQYNNLPVSKLNHSGISETERIQLHRERIKEEVKKELLKEMKND